MAGYVFAEQVCTEQALRGLLGMPSELVIQKQLSCLDKHCRAFIAQSPYVLVGTTDGEGRHDVSPRGDAPGFVRVLDDGALLIPERPGNRRLDSLRNILRTGSVGLLFLVPGIDETLRVNGRACLTCDAALLEGSEVQGKRPVLGIGVEVAECYLHCGKAAKRSRLWDQTRWPERSVLPSLGVMLRDQVESVGVSAAELDAQIEESYRTRLY